MMRVIVYQILCKHIYIIDSVVSVNCMNVPLIMILL